VIDNPASPTKATCDQAGCPNTLLANTAPDAPRALVRFQRRLGNQGWDWSVDYSNVITYCRDHAEVPVVQPRTGGRRRPPPPDPAA
jgi:hypothetical protein